jgi:hypothetical protein
MRFVIAMLAWAGAAQADSLTQIGPASPVEGTTFVILRETEEPGALVELLFYNANVNGPEDVGAYTVDYEGIEVTVRFHHNVSAGGADRIDVFAPPGMYAEPSSLTLMEGYSDVVFIFPLGMS